MNTTTIDTGIYADNCIDISDDVPAGIFLKQDGALWIAYRDGKRVAATGSRAGTIQQATEAL